MSAWQRRLDDLKRRAAAMSPVAGATGDNRVSDRIGSWHVMVSLNPMPSGAPRWHLSVGPEPPGRPVTADERGFPARVARHVGAPETPMFTSPNGIVHYQWEGEVSEPGKPVVLPADAQRYRVLRLAADGSAEIVGHALDAHTATSLAALDAGWSEPGAGAAADAGARRDEIRRSWLESKTSGAEARYYAVIDQTEGTMFFLPEVPPSGSGYAFRAAEAPES